MHTAEAARLWLLCPLILRTALTNEVLHPAFLLRRDVFVTERAAVAHIDGRQRLAEPLTLVLLHLGGLDGVAASFTRVHTRLVLALIEKVLLDEGGRVGERD
jgi:hypothetical protein